MSKLLTRYSSVPYVALAAFVTLFALPAAAGPFFFSTGTVNNLIATASRPGPTTGVNQETESADDFLLTGNTRLNSATFTGLLPASASIAQVVVEIYRVFPKDSNTARTSFPVAPFSTAEVPARQNSPSDVEVEDRNSAVAGELTFTTTLLSNFTGALNSVDTGIHPIPGFNTGGDGPVTGQEVQFNVTFSDPIDLVPDHYFFVPQVLLSNPNQHFLWLSASRPIDATGTPFAPDLQSWIRNDQLAPDWLRVGTDIVGGTTFNAAFSLTGSVPEPGTALLLGAGAIALWWRRRRG